jgi:hypothetical protein
MKAELTVPASDCPEANPFCEWMLFVDEPDVAGQPVVAEVTGSSGVLEVPYPPNFCGVLQADALVGPGNWVYQTGTRVTVNTCTSGSPSTAATSTFIDPNSATQSSTNQVATSASVATTTSAVSAKATTLPFTGVDAGPYALLGTSAFLIGLLLMAERSWLLGYRRLAASRPIRGVAGVLTWFIGH